VRPRLLLPLLAGSIVLWLAGCTTWRLAQAREMAQQSVPLQHRPPDAVLRMLVVGDSTAVGTGAGAATASVPGLLARDYPRLGIENRAQDGATFARVAEQLERAGRFDVVLLMAGGNDVIRLRSPQDLRGDVERALALARERAGHVVVMPAGNVGNAPFFFPPVSWEMTRRSRALHRIVRDAASRHGAIYVDLFRERDDDPFVSQPGLNARDGLHPSDAGYREWYRTLMSQSDLPARLAPARPGPR
jgi:lysophospholipase L1-like esterase